MWDSNGAADFNVGQWHHIAVVRNGSTWYLFRDGTEVHSDTDNSPILDISQPLDIGNSFDLGNAVYGYMPGYIDELRFSKGIARWTSGFTPPTSPYNPYE